VFFEHDRGKTHSSGKLLFSARVIPIAARGWISNTIRRITSIFRVDRRRKMPVTTLLKALRFQPRADTREVLSRSTPFHIAKDGDRVRARARAHARRDRSASTSWAARKLIVAKDKRITVKHVRDMEARGLTRIVAPEDFLLGRTACKKRRRLPQTGRTHSRSANDGVTETVPREACARRDVEKIQTIYNERPRSRGPYNLPGPCASTRRGPARRRKVRGSTA
jgi:DNA-directed RNA polymerase subunit beta